ncbi:hypothetical protein SNEBB_001606 [Seison nebaliae]|nr:hypothetical protein SNEBB_001606 [Seison nebaliae]
MNQSTKMIKLKDSEDDDIAIPIGTNKSGRPWKAAKCQSFGQFCRTSKTSKSSWEKKMKERNDRERIKNHEQSLKLVRKETKWELKERQRKNAERRKMNERKAEVVQPIKNPNNICPTNFSYVILIITLVYCTTKRKEVLFIRKVEYFFI